MRATEKRRKDDDVIGPLSAPVSNKSKKRANNNRKNVPVKKERSQIFSFRGLVAYMVFSTLLVTLAAMVVLFISPKGDEWSKWTLLNLNEEQWKTVLMVFRAALIGSTELLLILHAGKVAGFIKGRMKEFARPKLEYFLGLALLITLFYGVVREWEFVEKVRDANDEFISNENLQAITTVVTKTDKKDSDANEEKPNITVRMSDELQAIENKGSSIGTIHNMSMSSGFSNTRTQNNIPDIRTQKQIPNVRTHSNISSIRTQKQIPNARTNNISNIRTQKPENSTNRYRTSPGSTGGGTTYGPIRTRIR